MCHAFSQHSGSVHNIPQAFVLHRPNVASQCHNNVKPRVPRRGDGSRGRPQLSTRQCCDPKIATFRTDCPVYVMSTSVMRPKIKCSAALHKRSFPEVKRRSFRNCIAQSSISRRWPKPPAALNQLKGNASETPFFCDGISAEVRFTDHLMCHSLLHKSIYKG